MCSQIFSETSGDAVSPSPFELFDNYVHSARRMHEFTDSQNEFREHSSEWSETMNISARNNNFANPQLFRSSGRGMEN